MTEADVDRCQFEVIKTRSGDVCGAAFAFFAPLHLNFTLRREGRFDRWSKAIGLTKEVQFNDDRFDRIFFVDSDSRTFLNALQKYPQWRESLKELTARMAAHGATFSRMDCDGGTLRILADAKVSASTAELPGAVDRSLAPFLAGLRQLAVDTRPASETGFLEVNRVRRTMFGFLITALVAILTLNIFATAQVIDEWALYRLSGIISCVVYAFFLVWAYWRISRSSVRHRLLIELVLVGLPAVFLATTVAVRTVNVNLDFSRPTVVIANGARLYSTRGSGRMSDTQHWLGYVRSSAPLEGYSRALPIPWWKHEQLSNRWRGVASPDATLFVGNGALGLPWVDVK